MSAPWRPIRGLLYGSSLEIALDHDARPGGDGGPCEHTRPDGTNRIVIRATPDDPFEAAFACGECVLAEMREALE